MEGLIKGIELREQNHWQPQDLDRHLVAVKEASLIYTFKTSWQAGRGHICITSDCASHIRTLLQAKLFNSRMIAELCAEHKHAWVIRCKTATHTTQVQQGVPFVRVCVQVCQHAPFAGPVSGVAIVVLVEVSGGRQLVSYALR